MNAIRILWLRFQAAMHSVDAYLYRQQGRYIEAADAECRAYECERQISLLSINEAQA